MNTLVGYLFSALYYLESFGGFILKENLPQELTLYYQMFGYRFDI